MRRVLERLGSHWPASPRAGEETAVEDALERVSARRRRYMYITESANIALFRLIGWGLTGLKGFNLVLTMFSVIVVYPAGESKVMCAPSQLRPGEVLTVYLKFVVKVIAANFCSGFSQFDPEGIPKQVVTLIDIDDNFSCIHNEVGVSRKRTQKGRIQLKQTHPDLPPLNQGTISKIEAQYREMGHVRKVPSKRQAVVHDDKNLNLLLALEENPITPARQLARDSNLNHKTVLKILKYEKKRPYKMQAVQELWIIFK
ncbi:hypothetical protein NQ318_000249 [Aromia moschata]|uniref:Transposase n=1 Tax=Aromia moschata TaxID=1265417 RepID=A0AAV8YUR1_9CUCU|nr:hypothetical protein NQ318_000249 [Aromia moschata]